MPNERQWASLSKTAKSPCILTSNLLCTRPYETVLIRSVSSALTAIQSAATVIFMELLGKVLEALVDKLFEHVSNSGWERLTEVIGERLAGHPVLLGILLVILVLCGTIYVVQRIIRKFRHNSHVESRPADTSADHE